jgi:aspartyl-tRNA(Asn)/glutamyl-tRNA(Gln) amidotransferase subunit A
MTVKHTATIVDAAASLRRGSLRAVDLVDAALAAIDEHDGRTNAFISVHADQARAEARTADRELARGVDRGPLHGIPMSLKDLIDAAGVVTTAGSRVLADRIATADAPVVTRLREAGAVIIGRTNLHEFALGTTSEDSAFGPVRHPADPVRSAGGSSGGSAVAVALGMGLASIGTDTGGSIRIPAAACGVVGLKPSAGDVPTAGVIPLSPSFDHVGPLATSVGDAAVVWAVIAGLTPAPLETVRPSGLRFARLGGYFNAPLAPAVRAAFETAMSRLEAAGIEIRPGEIAGAASIAEAYVNTVLPEAAAWHATYLDARGPLYTPVVRARLQSGRTIPAVAYLAARDVIEAIRRAVDAALASFDALVLPTLPLLAPPLGAADVEIDQASGDRLTVRAAMLKHTQPFNLSGHPAISLPLAVSGLPVGLQIVGPRNDTARLLALAAACEKILGHA